ncbi:putative retrotransposon protein, partial [Klebsormidium nitens]
MSVLNELQALHQAWGQPMAYLIEHVAAGHDKRPRVREHFEAVRGLLGLEVVLDAAQLGSRAHRLRAWWTNLEGVSLLREALATGGLTHSLGAEGGSSAADGQVTFEEPTADERALAMGFPREFGSAPGISELTRRELLGQAMDLNSLMWILAACREGGRRRKVSLGGDRVVGPAGSETVGRARQSVAGAGAEGRAEQGAARRAAASGCAGRTRKTALRDSRGGKAQVAAVGAAVGEGTGAGLLAGQAPGSRRWRP